MTTAAPANALCIGCNYPLRQLAEPRCPECGRAFDPLDRGTFNTGHPLTAFDRFVLAPIGVPTFVIITLLCGAILWLALYPAIYYMFIYVILLFIFWATAGALILVRIVVRAALAIRIPHLSDPKRLRALLIMLMTTTAFVVFHIPLYAEFLLARPGLQQWVREIENGTAPAAPSTRRVGLFTISQSTYSDEHTFFFEISSGGGFAYHSGDDELDRHYNAGADGHLIGNWYWWIDD